MLRYSFRYWFEDMISAPFSGVIEVEGGLTLAPTRLVYLR
jgi:hypothetical protein